MDKEYSMTSQACKSAAKIKERKLQHPSQKRSPHVQQHPFIIQLPIYSWYVGWFLFTIKAAHTVKIYPTKHQTFREETSLGQGRVCAGEAWPFQEDELGKPRDWVFMDVFRCFMDRFIMIHLWLLLVLKFIWSMDAFWLVHSDVYLFFFYGWWFCWFPSNSAVAVLLPRVSMNSESSGSSSEESRELGERKGWSCFGSLKSLTLMDSRMFPKQCVHTMGFLR